MIQTAGDAILRDIIDHPEDDALRLIYADWLDDHGEEGHAAFLREWLTRPDTAFVQTAANARVLRTYPGGPTHLAVLPDRCDEATWRRGFVERVRLPILDWLRVGRALRREHPLTRVEVSDRVPRCDREGEWSWYAFQGWRPRKLPAYSGGLPSSLIGPFNDLHRSFGGLRTESPPDSLRLTGTRHTWTFPDRKAAEDCLSLALLLLASGERMSDES